MYCDIVRFGSSADAETAKQSTIAPAIAHFGKEQWAELPLRKIFKFLNHDFAALL